MISTALCRFWNRSMFTEYWETWLQWNAVCQRPTWDTMADCYLCL